MFRLFCFLADSIEFYFLGFIVAAVIVRLLAYSQPNFAKLNRQNLSLGVSKSR
jgi:hypothetical protein